MENSNRGRTACPLFSEGVSIDAAIVVLWKETGRRDRRWKHKTSQCAAARPHDR
jgi:hypothetical protein